MCRMRLFTLAGVESSDVVPEKTTEWRDSCAVTLMMTVRMYIKA